MLRQIVGTWLVVPIGEKVVDFNGMFTLTETGAFLWKLLEKGCGSEELVASLLEEYEIDAATAKADVEEFLANLRSSRITED